LPASQKTSQPESQPASHPTTRDVISVCSRGGLNFDRLPRRGQNMKKQNFVCKNTKITIFQIQGGGNAPHAPSK